MKGPRWYWIEGMAICGLAQVLALCRHRGALISSDTLRKRLLAGVDTWAGLCAPVDRRASALRAAHAATAARRAKAAAAREEMRQLIAAVDRRKRAREST